jgi:hypothetical protein
MFDRAKVRVTRLRSVGEIVHELGKLYRQVRRGDVDTSEGFRMASILGIMRQCLEGSDAAKSRHPVTSNQALSLKTSFLSAVFTRDDPSIGNRQVT